MIRTFLLCGAVLASTFAMAQQGTTGDQSGAAPKAQPVAPDTSNGCATVQTASALIGKEGCITGKLLRVGSSRGGMQFLNFCKDYRNCPFQAVVFPRDARKVGDLYGLEGKVVTLRGKVQEYKGQSEIVIKNRSQISGEIGAAPAQFDADRSDASSEGLAPKRKRDRAW